MFKAMANLIKGVKQAQEVTFCDSCGQVCDQECRVQNLLNRNEEYRARLQAGL